MAKIVVGFAFDTFSLVWSLSFPASSCFFAVITLVCQGFGLLCTLKTYQNVENASVNGTFNGKKTNPNFCSSKLTVKMTLLLVFDAWLTLGGKICNLQTKTKYDPYVSERKPAFKYFMGKQYSLKLCFSNTGPWPLFVHKFR